MATGTPDVPNAKIGDEYRYAIVNCDTGNTYSRNDPYAYCRSIMAVIQVP
ncbi:hypothetical protein [Scytonema sp. UIC 10036]|nr:hypothetical protein [Scytonema sp. UIC 10036]